jgi:predicted DsbA family dithiol-disulfide isomerase
MQPIVHGLQDEYKDQLVVESHNADLAEAQALAEQLGVRGHPAYAIVDSGGTVRWTGKGAVPVDLLRKVIEEHALR